MIYYINAAIIIICFYLNYNVDLTTKKILSSEKSLSNYLFCIVSMLSVSFSGLRYQTGTDWHGYQESFENPFLVQQYEIGYKLLAEFLSINGLSFDFLLFFISCFYGLLCYVIFKLCVNKWLGLILLNANISILYFGGNRQAIGEAIALFAVFLVLNNLLKSNLSKATLAKTLLLFALSALFHSSTLLFGLIFLMCFLLKRKTEIVIKTTFVFNFITILFGGKNPFASIISFLSKMTGIESIVIYIENTESGVVEVDSARDIVIILYNMSVLFLVYRALKFNFQVSPTLSPEKTSEYYGIIVNLVAIFYFIFCLYLGVSRDTSGRLLLYGRFFECVFFGSLNYYHLVQTVQPYIFSVKNILSAEVIRSRYLLLVNSVVLLSLLKLYFTFISNGYYLPYQTILAPGKQLY
jgi:hypothetical protein